MTLYGAAKAQVETFEADRRSGAAGVRSAIATRDSRTHHRRSEASILVVDVGVTIWTNPAKHRGPDDEVAQQDGSMSGIVLEVLTGSVTLDGEVVPTRYRVFNYFAQRAGERFPRWQDDWIDVYRTEATDLHLLARSVRRLCEMVGRGSSLLTSTDARTLEDAQRLTRLLMGGAGHG